MTSVRAEDIKLRVYIISGEDVRAVTWNVTFENSLMYRRAAGSTGDGTKNGRDVVITRITIPTLRNLSSSIGIHE